MPDRFIRSVKVVEVQTNQSWWMISPVVRVHADEVARDKVKLDGCHFGVASFFPVTAQRMG